MVDDESFDFSGLTLKLQTRIVEKFLYKDFAQLDESSKLGHAISWTQPYSLPAYMPTVYINEEITVVSLLYHYFENEKNLKIPWHIASQPPARIIADSVFVTERLSGGRMQVVAQQFKENNISVSMVTLKEDIGFAPKDLDDFLTAISPKHLTCHKFFPKEYFQSPALHRINNLYLMDTGCTDEELVLLKPKDMLQLKTEFVTAKGLNNLLKQWKRNDRELNTINIEWGSTISINFEDILEGVDANPIWTPEMHENSVIGGIKLEDFYPMTTGDPDNLYVLWRPEDPMDTKFLRLKKGSFEVFSGSGEATLLLRYLNDDQFYSVTNKCIECYTQFCEHRRPPFGVKVDEVVAQE